MRTERKTDTRHARAKKNRKERANRYWESRKWRKDNQDAKKDECAGAGHRKSISGLYNDNKLASDRFCVHSEMS